MIVYGIKNCDTVKKVTTWLDKKKIAYEFHDYKKSGIELSTLKSWTDQVSWEILLNKKGTTWKAIDPKIQAKITDRDSAIKLMSEHTSLIKRPVIEIKGKVAAVGFKEEEYVEKFSSK